MTDMISDVPKTGDADKPTRVAGVDGLDEQLIDQLVIRAKAGGLRLTGLTDVGPVEITVPRACNGQLRAQIVAKRQKRLTGVDERVISLAAKGLTTRGDLRAPGRGLAADVFHDHRQGARGHDRMAEPTARPGAVSISGCESAGSAGRVGAHGFRLWHCLCVTDPVRVASLQLHEGGSAHPQPGQMVASRCHNGAGGCAWQRGQDLFGAACVVQHDHHTVVGQDAAVQRRSRVRAGRDRRFLGVSSVVSRRVVAEVGQYGGNAVVKSGLFSEPEFGEGGIDVFFDGGFGQSEGTRSGIPSRRSFLGPPAKSQASAKSVALAICAVASRFARKASTFAMA